MIVPDRDGFYFCNDCEFQTDNLFALFDHCMIKFKFNLRLSRMYTLDMFALLKGIYEAIEDEDVMTARNLIQMATLTLTNSTESKKDFNEFISEAFIKENAEILVQELEDMLKEEKNG